MLTYGMDLNMRMVSKSVVVLGVWVFCLAAAHAQNPGGDSASKPLKNPVPATPASIAAGRAGYTKNCSHCHGPSGAGDGRFAPKDPSPADLTDEKWDHGSSDADIFSVIWNGPSEKATMKPLKGKLPEKDVWNIVNYVRSLGPKSGGR